MPSDDTTETKGTDSSSPSNPPNSNVTPSVSDALPTNDEQPVSTATTLSMPESRGELLNKARSFLHSQQVQIQDVAVKRKFLSEKGLNEMEIDSLLRELPSQLPLIPPRTYPQPPPSNLPTLLLGVVRIFSWLAGGSAVLIFIYYRFLLPRIIKTSEARKSLISHHLSLIRRLSTSLSSLKESQAESLTVLPHLEAFKENLKFVSCNSIKEILQIIETEKVDLKDVSPVTILRCGILDFGKGKDGDDMQPVTEDLFRYLEGQIPWLVSEDGQNYELELWDMLTSCPFFVGNPLSLSATIVVDNDKNANTPTRWAYVAPPPSTLSPLERSLERLSNSLPRNVIGKTSPFQHGLQTLSNFTGYISTQVYLPHRNLSSGIGTPDAPRVAEEELRKEIRALKGLVLNRRSFLPPRAPSRSSIPSSS